jgi:hypothetical protein
MESLILNYMTPLVIGLTYPLVGLTSITFNFIALIFYLLNKIPYKM